MKETRDYLGLQVRDMRPTKAHRPAIWECMLGTVYAMNRAGVIEFFDYDYEAAFRHAELDHSDLRLARSGRHYSDANRPYPEQMVIWTR